MFDVFEVVRDAQRRPSCSLTIEDARVSHRCLEILERLIDAWKFSSGSSALGNSRTAHQRLETFENLIDAWEFSSGSSALERFPSSSSTLWTVHRRSGLLKATLNNRKLKNFALFYDLELLECVSALQTTHLKLILNIEWLNPLSTSFKL